MSVELYVSTYYRNFTAGYDTLEAAEQDALHYIPVDDTEYLIEIYEVDDDDEKYVLLTWRDDDDEAAVAERLKLLQQ